GRPRPGWGHDRGAGNRRAILGKRWQQSWIDRRIVVVARTADRPASPANRASRERAAERHSLRAIQSAPARDVIACGRILAVCECLLGAPAARRTRPDSRWPQALWHPVG